MSHNEINDFGWKVLLSEIRNGNVIPIIGSELSKIEVAGKEEQLDEYLLKELIKKNEMSDNFSDFTQLEHCREWKNRIEDNPTCMQLEIKKLYNSLNPTPSIHLKKLLKIKEFKIILTTTFDNLIEQALHDKYGIENVKVYNYELNDKDNDINESDLINDTKTILFHMFGKLGDLDTSFVLSEDDLLKYMINWINISSSPKNLINYLRNKHLLVLGCNYPNWLFKFFLHAIKYNFEDNKLNVNPRKSLVADFYKDDGLDFFLSRINTRFHNDPEAFIDELLERYEHDEDGNSEERQFNDIFISYAHEDEEAVDKVVNELKNSKIGVWFDKNKDERGLAPGDKFEMKIKRNIANSKMFVPVLSKNTLVDRRFFRKEWNLAIEESKGSYKNYIFPIIIDDDLDLNHEAIADEFRDLHTLKVDMDNIKESMRELIRKINKDKRIPMKPL